MTATAPKLETAADRAAMAAVLVACDPAGLGGAVVRARAGPVRDRWVEAVRSLVPAGTPVRRVPLHICDDRLLGGLDLAATLSAGRAVAATGLLAEANNGILILASAERVAAGPLARIASAMDRGWVQTERDGLTFAREANIGLIALDEGIDDDERPLPALLDRLAFYLDISEMGVNDIRAVSYTAAEVADARYVLADVRVSDEAIEALCEAAVAFGVASVRGPLFALKAARISAALNGRRDIRDDDVALAAALILAPRATRLPPLEDQDDDVTEPDQPDQNEPDQSSNEEDDDQKLREDPLDDIVLQATEAAIPAGLLAKLKLSQIQRTKQRAQGRAGALQMAKGRGRPAGVRAGRPTAGVRLNVIETLRAAAPWQRLRQAKLSEASRDARRISIHPSDFRITRFKRRSETATIFVVDASGSSALHRLGEAKGAVELLLADCYVRRDNVGLIAFRGTKADVLLPPTRSLVRAKRSLASLPGGGGTPLAAGLDQALILALASRAKGMTPTIVILTDGRANVGRNGKGGRPSAEADALNAASGFKIAGLASLLIDTSPHRNQQAEKVANALGAQYLALPYADANFLSEAVKSSAAARSR